MIFYYDFPVFVLVFRLAWAWVCFCCVDDLVTEKEKSKLLQEEMEMTLHDIQNM